MEIGVNCRMDAIVVGRTESLPEQPFVRHWTGKPIDITEIFLETALNYFHWMAEKNNGVYELEHKNLDESDKFGKLVYTKNI